MFGSNPDDQEDVLTPIIWDSLMFYYVIFGVLLTGIGSFFSSSGSLLINVVPFLTAGVGVWFLWRAFRPFVQRWIYGSSRLELQTAPVPVGTQLRARLQVDPGPAEQPPDGFHFTVIGYIGGRSKRKNDDYLAERRTAHAQGQRRAGRTAVPVSIELPEAPSIGHPQVELERLNWELEVTAEVDGKPDYEASFDLPVTTEVPDPEPELDTSSAPPADPRDDTVNKDEDHSEREPAADEKDDTGEDAYWAVDEDGTETRLRSSESETPETVTDQASNEKGSARTRSGSSVKNRLVLLGSGGLSLAAGLALIFMDEPELVRVLCGLGMALFGGLLVYGGLTGS